MKQRFKFFCFLLLVFLFPAPAMAQATTECAQKEQEYTPLEERYSKGIIFRVEKCGQPVSFIMGTMHLDDSRINPIFSAAVALLQQVEAAGFEFVEDDKTATVAQQYLFLPATQPVGLSALITPEEFGQLAKEAQERMKLPLQAVDRLHPWAAAVLLQFPPPTGDGIALDNRIQQQAAAMDLPMFSLETPAEQYEVFARIPHDQQVAMLKDTLRDLPEIDELNRDLLAEYINRNLTAMEEIATTSIALNSDAGLAEYLQEKLINERNRLMVRRMQPRMFQGPVLVAIGALHLIGEQGIIPLLEKDGWRIYVNY